jgi:hypothetical protein
MSTNGRKPWGPTSKNAFLYLGKHLRQLLDRDLELFKKVVDKTPLGRREAYYLVEVSRKFDPLRSAGPGSRR